MAQMCRCGHPKTRHRGQYGEPYSGPCRNCSCGSFNKAGVVARLAITIALVLMLAGFAPAIAAEAEEAAPAPAARIRPLVRPFVDVPVVCAVEFPAIDPCGPYLVLTCWDEEGTVVYRMERWHEGDECRFIPPQPPRPDR